MHANGGLLWVGAEPDFLAAPAELEHSENQSCFRHVTQSPLESVIALVFSSCPPQDKTLKVNPEKELFS